ncbi:hypothetical protein [Wenzhouxiangella sp. EGI_FJ10305]|uniref:hypothetical protein n=1 Tax=Wenzhouxiangella sp. EGI_FJ10305 TaxID=3243768 RepID=UPI0035DCA173
MIDYSQLWETMQSIVPERELLIVWPMDAVTPSITEIGVIVPPDLRQDSGVPVLEEPQLEKGLLDTGAELDIGQLIKLPDSQSERLSQLCMDDDEESHYVKTVLAKAIIGQYSISKGLHRSRAGRDDALDIAKDISLLRQKIQWFDYNHTVTPRLHRAAKNGHDPSAAYHELDNLSEFYKQIADDLDPKGKRQKSNHLERFVAKALCDGVRSGVLALPPLQNNNSELAELFRFCLDALNLQQPSNIQYYLSEHLSSA